MYARWPRVSYHPLLTTRHGVHASTAQRTQARATAVVRWREVSSSASSTTTATHQPVVVETGSTSSTTSCGRPCCGHDSEGRDPATHASGTTHRQERYSCQDPRASQQEAQGQQQKAQGQQEASIATVRATAVEPASSSRACVPHVRRRRAYKQACLSTAAARYAQHSTPHYTRDSSDDRWLLTSLERWRTSWLGLRVMAIPLRCDPSAPLAAWNFPECSTA